MTTNNEVCLCHGDKPPVNGFICQETLDAVRKSMDERKAGNFITYGRLRVPTSLAVKLMEEPQ